MKEFFKMLDDVLKNINYNKFVLKSYYVEFSEGYSKNCREGYRVKAFGQREAFWKALKMLNEDFTVEGIPYFYIEKLK